MHFSTLHSFIKAHGRGSLPGTVAVIFIEDAVEVASTLKHHLDLGFDHILAIGRHVPEARDQVIKITHDIVPIGAVADVLTRLMPIFAGQWVFTCYNAEYLMFPFSDQRKFPELVAFHREEKRRSMLATVIDLYPGDLTTAPNGVDLQNAFLDRSGYYTQYRWNPDEGEEFDRTFDLYGGLRWRYQDLVPFEQRRIDRVAIYMADKKLVMQDDFTLSDPELNTIMGEWHANLTAAVMSFRAAKSLCCNPGSRHKINDFKWFNSVAFDWRSKQLLDLGLIEAGQWF